MLVTYMILSLTKRFRWVVCQLDHLCELLTDKARRKALSSLPPTLPATYERMLTKIDCYSESLRSLVERSLLLLAHNESNLSMAEFCEAVSISPNSTSLDDEDIIEEEEIFRLCGSLVRKSNDGKHFEYAHFTVREFLEGACSQHPQFERYSVSSNKSTTYVALVCLRYLNLNTTHRAEKRPFYEHACVRWPRYVHMASCEGQDNVVAALHELFDLRKRQTFIDWAEEYTMHCLCVYIKHFQPRLLFEFFWDLGGDCETPSARGVVRRPDFTPFHMAAALGLSGLCSDLLRAGARVNLRSGYGTPLTCAVGGRLVFSDESLTDCISGDSQNELAGSLSSRVATVRVLLSAGAKADGVSLQLAIANQSGQEGLDIIVDLLNAGASATRDDLEAFRALWDRILRQSRDEDRDIDKEKAISLLVDALEK